MLSVLPRMLVLFFCFVLLPGTQAGAAEPTYVEATGQAGVHKGNITAARAQAVADAKQQAALQAAAFISSTQQVDDGILELDNLRISTQGMIDQVEILEEKLFGNRLHVRIRALVNVQTNCPNGSSGNSFRKTVAVAAFPLEYPAQASLGDFSNMPSQLADSLVRRLTTYQNLQPLNAGNLLLYPSLATASTRQLPDGTLNQLLPYAKQLDVQYVLSGIVRDISMQDPSVTTEKNWAVKLYKNWNKNNPRFLRNFALDVFLHDGFSGTLLYQQAFSVQGLWSEPPNRKVGFNTPAFMQTDYGQRIAGLLDKVAKEMHEDMRCRPFSARITRTQDSQIWINAGQLSGLSRGDKLAVYRKSTFYSPTGGATTELTNTRQTLTIEQLQPTTANGRIPGSAAENNIQAGDLAIFW